MRGSPARRASFCTRRCSKTPRATRRPTMPAPSISYGQARERLLRELDRMEDLPDDEFDRKREQLFAAARQELHRIHRADPLCTDAELVDIMLADVPVDACLGDLMKLEERVRGRLGFLPGFDDAPHFWADGGPQDDAERIARVEEPTLVAWLHTLEAISQLCLASARYRAAADYARRVMRAQGYPNLSAGTVLLALARLEDEDGFFACALRGGRRLRRRRGLAVVPARAHDPALQARTPQERPARAARLRRALRRRRVLPAQPHLFDALPARAAARPRGMGARPPGGLGGGRHHRRHARLHRMGGVRRRRLRRIRALRQPQRVLTGAFFAFRARPRRPAPFIWPEARRPPSRSGSRRSSSSL